MAYPRDDDRRRDRNARTRARLQRRDVDNAMGASMRGDDNDEERLQGWRQGRREAFRDHEWGRTGRRGDPDEFAGEPRPAVPPGRDYGGFGGRGYGTGHDRDYGYGIRGAGGRDQRRQSRSKQPARQAANVTFKK
ncbi:hypothetical protein [Reyranella sp.]|uniref:hypothetical protein n=1 Tax=Reyranella sp. TaxID=1929291 RepID=UPI003784EF8C